MTVDLRKYQTFWQRLGAAIIDFPVFLPIYITGYFFFGESADKNFYWVLFQYVISFGYSIFCHHKYGYTIGKKVSKIKVVQHDDESKLLSLKQAFMRDSIGVLFMFLDFYIIASELALTEFGDAILGLTSLVWIFVELITMLFNEKRRSVHDFLASSVCIDTTFKTEWEKRYKN